MEIISNFWEFCFAGIFFLQVLILWALLTIDRELKQVQKDMEGWVK
jgi:hypothetical protein|tara:strand:- start:19 stop:156 length:138 start_codon:yes stop_codon:yes gene_type:complete